LSFPRWLDPRLAIFGREDHVVVQAQVGRGHGAGSVSKTRGGSKGLILGLGDN
jgi:hypothetical protein